MCWMSVSVPVEKIAEDDIPIFKICLTNKRGDCCSYYKYFVYELNKEYRNTDGTCLVIYYNATLGAFKIEEGYHSYNPQCRIKKTISGCRLLSLTMRGTLDVFSEKEQIVIVRGYIPKGTRYYENTRGEYVSEAIVLTHYEKINYDNG